MVTSILLEDQYKIVIIFRSILLIMRNVSDKLCRENQNKFMFYNFFRKSCHSWDNVKKYCTAGQATHNYSACALHSGYLRLQTHSQNMSCLLLSSRQQWLNESASMLRYTLSYRAVWNWKNVIISVETKAGIYRVSFIYLFIYSLFNGALSI